MARRLKARPREGSGKGVARKLRASGEVPAVAYGHGVESRSLSVSTHELELLLATINPENTLIELEVEGSGPASALIRQVQHHPSRPVILHVDFFQVRAGEKLQVAIPVILHGTPIGVSEQGGVLQEVLRELTVACLPKDIPTSIDVDIAALELGGVVHVSDVRVENAEILNDPELVICTISHPTVEEAPEEPETEPGVGGEVQPELIRDRREGAEEVPSEGGSAASE
jgi:large subunit ribosomal protein L25